MAKIICHSFFETPYVPQCRY